MKGFPKVIKTKSDLVNTFKLVQKKRLKRKIGWQQLKTGKSELDYVPGH